MTDAQSYTPDGLYDLITCNGSLHYVRDKDSVISLMQQATCDDGINVISLWSNYAPVPECHEFVPVYSDAEDGVVTSRIRHGRRNSSTSSAASLKLHTPTFRHTAIVT